MAASTPPKISLPKNYHQLIHAVENSDPMYTICDFHPKWHEFTYLNGETYLQVIQCYFNALGIIHKARDEDVSNPISNDEQKGATNHKRIVDHLMTRNWIGKDGYIYDRKGGFMHLQKTIHAFLVEMTKSGILIQNPFPVLATVVQSSPSEVATQELGKPELKQTSSIDDYTDFLNMTVTDGKRKGSKYIDLYNNKVAMEELNKLFAGKELGEKQKEVGNIRHFMYWSRIYAEYNKPIEQTVLTEGEYKGRTYTEMLTDVEGCDLLSAEVSADANAPKGNIAHFLYFRSQ